MITVYTFGSAWGAVDLSPFVVKLLTWLRMAGVPHRTALGDMRKAPHRKLPYIEDGGRLIGDSSLIIEHILAKEPSLRLAGDDLPPPLAAVAAAFKGMIESELYFVIVYTRWAVDLGYATYRPVLVSSLAKMGLPAALVSLALPLLRRRMIAQVYEQGMGRHERGVIFAKGRRHIDAIAAYLADKPYFMGDEPGTIDATVFGFLDALTSTPLCPLLTDHVLQHANLAAYHARMWGRYWSDVAPPAASSAKPRR